VRTKAVVSLKFSSKKKLKSLIDALSPELRKNVGSRAKADLRSEGNLLLLSVGADNAVMLRSALNAYLRWMDSVTNVIELLDRSP